MDPRYLAYSVGSADNGAPDSLFEAKAYQLLVSNRYGTLGRWLGILSAGLLFSLFAPSIFPVYRFFRIMAGRYSQARDWLDISFVQRVSRVGTITARRQCCA